MLQVKPKKFTYFIGVDVSRNELDYAVMHGKTLLFHRESKNDQQAISSFVQDLKDLPEYTMTRAVFCMEHTGIYCNHLLYSLKKLKANIVMENPLHIKNSLGIIRGKTDKVDAIRIARYAYTNREKLSITTIKRPIMIQLTNLVSIRNRLLALQVALKTPLKEQQSFVQKTTQRDSINACKRSLDGLSADLIGVEESIDEVIRSDDYLTNIYNIITSVPNIGRVTAIQIIVSTNEFRNIKDPKKFACYAGVAPFKRESGLFKGKSKLSHIANKKVKTLLHTCAITSIRIHGGQFREYYERKLAEGKPKLSILNAIRYKLIVRVFACVNQNRLFDKNYLRQQSVVSVPVFS